VHGVAPMKTNAARSDTADPQFRFGHPVAPRATSGGTGGDEAAAWTR
jgi:hypothetical protein